MIRSRLPVQRRRLRWVAILALAGTAVACHQAQPGSVRPESRNGGGGVVIDREDLNLAGVTNTTQLFVGRIPGVALQSSGSRLIIVVRGLVGSSGRGALLLVDGIRSPANDLIHLNPRDIQTIRVIKDASALVYGEGAAYGVVAITTRRY